MKEIRQHLQDRWIKIKERLKPPNVLFRERLVRTIDLLSACERTYQNIPAGPQKQQFISRFLEDFWQDLCQESSIKTGNKKERADRQAEMKIFQKIFKLSSLKNELQTKKQETLIKRIGFLATLGAGKSIVSRALVRKLKKDGENVLFKKEPYLGNPFWRRSQKDKKFMLRSQVFFLLTNLLSQLEKNNNTARNNPTLLICDTSIYTDALMWARWYRNFGYFDKDEYAIYERLFKLLTPVFPQLDLLVIFTPEKNSLEGVDEYAEKLITGVNRRLKKVKSRSQEKRFTHNIKYLREQTMIVLAIMSDFVSEKKDVNFLNLVVDPIKVYRNPKYRKEIIGRIRDELTRL